MLTISIFINIPLFTEQDRKVNTSVTQFSGFGFFKHLCMAQQFTLALFM